jgi:hypothetical protein
MMRGGAEKIFSISVSISHFSLTRKVSVPIEEDISCRFV